MLIAVLVIGFAIIIFQLGAQRILLVEQIKQLRMLNILVEQIEGIDGSMIEATAQREIDIAAGR